jgi:hypothetical protein
MVEATPIITDTKANIIDRKEDVELRDEEAGRAQTRVKASWVS